MVQCLALLPQVQREQSLQPGFKLLLGIPLHGGDPHTSGGVFPSPSRVSGALLEGISPSHPSGDGFTLPTQVQWEQFIQFGAELMPERAEA